jgi:hypothetical protein
MCRLSLSDPKYSWIKVAAWQTNPPNNLLEILKLCLLSVTSYVKIFLENVDEFFAKNLHGEDVEVMFLCGTQTTDH